MLSGVLLFSSSENSTLLRSTYVLLHPFRTTPLLLGISSPLLSGQLLLSLLSPGVLLCNSVYYFSTPLRTTPPLLSSSPDNSTSLRRISPFLTPPLRTSPFLTSLWSTTPLLTPLGSNPHTSPENFASPCSSGWTSN